MPALGFLVPADQRRTLDELTDKLDLSVGAVTAKRSAFWIMLVLSAVIAISGVIGDSTATVIGAMIVAPGCALVRRRPRSRSARSCCSRPMSSP